MSTLVSVFIVERGKHEKRSHRNALQRDAVPTVFLLAEGMEWPWRCSPAVLDLAALDDYRKVPEMKPTAIFLCSKTPNMALPWAEAGYDCICVDIQHSIRRDKEA